MLCLNVPDVELWDEKNEQFIYQSGGELRLEHSLVSLSKWESKYHKPFLSKADKTYEEVIDYIRCMVIEEPVNPDIFNILSEQNMREIECYLNQPMTATTFSKEKTMTNGGKAVTSELIYYWMASMNIPIECQHWHLNRLFTLIRVCTVENQPKKKTSTRDLLRRNSTINATRRKKFNTRG